MAPQLPNQTDLQNLKKFPWQWAVIILITAICAVVGYVLTRVNKGDENCDLRIATLQRIITKKDSIIFDVNAKQINLYNELLYKNNIIDRQNQVISKTDSVTRTILEKPAKQIVKANAIVNGTAN